MLILCCDGRFALEKRSNKGLLAGLWQFPNVPGKLNAQATLEKVESLNIKPKELLLQVERKHIFTHKEWDMRGAYVEVANCGGDFLWLTAEQINDQIALPTAFRLFWEEAAGKIFLKNPE